MSVWFDACIWGKPSFIGALAAAISVILLIAIVGLICVLMPGIGKSINGARRWIGLGFLAGIWVS